MYTNVNLAAPGGALALLVLSSCFQPLYIKRRSSNSRTSCFKPNVGRNTHVWL